MPEQASPQSGDLAPTVRFDRLLDEVYPRFNALHRTVHSRRFWAILLYRYLSKCMVVDGARLQPRDAPRSVPNDEAVFGPRVGDEHRPPSRERRRRRTFEAVRERLSAVPRTPAALQDWARLRRLRRTPIDSSRSVLADFHHFHVIVGRVNQPAAWLNAQAMTIPLDADDSRRDALRELSKGVASPLARLAFDWMPRWYVEEFRSRYAGVPMTRPEAKELHASFLSSTEGQFFVARYVEAGAPLTIYQHAAMYGEVDEHVLHHVESMLADRFCTWGWAIRSTDVPFLALRLMKPAGQAIRPRPSASRWLYVHVRQPFPWLVPRTLELQDRFFSTLKEARAREVVIRPRVNKGGSVLGQMSDRARRSALAIDEGTSKWFRLANDAELVILDSFPSTVFMECLSVELPVIAIVSEATTFTRVAASFYDHFFEAGVLHRTPESAARFLNDLDVHAWWTSVRAQDWFPEYRRTFCRTEG